MKPEWWRDKVLMTRTKADTRELYQGLWMVADDGGFFEWDATEIGAEIYPFVSVTRREKDVERHALLLEALEPKSPHLIRHACGHAEVPKMPQHQRIQPDKRVYTHRKRHESHNCPRRPETPRGDPQDSVPVGNEVGDGKGRNGTVSARERETTPTGTSLPFTFEEAVGGRPS